MDVERRGLNEFCDDLMVDVNVRGFRRMAWFVLWQGLNGGSGGHGEWEEDGREGEEVEGVLVEDCDCLSEETVVADGGGSH
ncbi:hypothetical protein CTI12_AA242920 [Artemisia annua]|uniref:Uncharacterized protein n=1 Tax=Artemisia annua TaxID=35608 RepID=A0A2U1KIR3_ARTAN|nr:hypothetical protein CTI12_AA596580 [Artemisia annua]PWA75437.1 hypothetical protein CTI12_AA242920 [Artemisia annua]